MARAAGGPVSDGLSYDVIAVRYGTRSTTRSDVFLHYSLYGEPDAQIGMDYFFWVLRNPERTILVDCGFNAASGRRRGRTMLSAPAEALRALGTDPAEVNLLIATHGHYDHIGNLGEFATAEVVMSQREYDFWTGPLASRRLFATSAEADDIDALRRVHAGGRLRLLPGSGEIAPGVGVIEVGGHTPGQLIVTAEMAGGTAVIASDAVHYYEELRLDRPFAHVADLPAMYAGFELLRSLATDASHYLVAGHDPEVMQRFTPLEIQLNGTPLAVRIGPP